MSRLNDLLKDLRTLSGLLDGWNKNVKNASSLCGLPINRIKKNKFQYEIMRSSPLIFSNIDIERHSLPQGIEKIKKNQRITEVKLASLFIEKLDIKDSEDPFEELGVNINVNLTIENNEGEWKEYTCSWHLDKGAPLGSAFTHPLYHMTFGGDHMVKNKNFGNLLLLTAPRIIHPPMDIILACDFIIKNFYSIKNHQEITSLPAYQSILNNSKSRYWKFYTGSFISKWHLGFGDSKLSHQKLVGN